MYKIIVSSRGRVVLPSEIRKKLNIKEGDMLSADVEGDGRLVFRVTRKYKSKKGKYI